MCSLCLLSHILAVLLLPRYLVVTKERLIVLDSGGGGIGTEATVKSNHHLTELVKLTFRKRDPESLTLHVTNCSGVASEDVRSLDEKSRGTVPIATKSKNYRVTKRDEIVDVLQVFICA
jgi:hypothetical protein